MSCEALDFDHPSPAAINSPCYGKERLDTPPGMSRNQFKKQLKVQQREERGKKKKKKKFSGTRAPTISYSEEEQKEFRQLKLNRKIHTTKPDSLCIYIDCDWEHEMTEKECQGISKQLRICYGKNKEYPAEYKAKMRITSLAPTGNIKRFLDEVEANNWFCKLPEKEAEWHVGMREWDYITEAQNEMKFRGNDMDVIYLTGDSPNELETIDNNTIYILGGLLDHNRLKRATLERAESLNIKTRRLPIAKYIRITRRAILTVNHVFEILLAYQKYQNWEKVFLSVLPARMDPKPITSPQSQEINE